jgi:outer membrane protein OmpA-like peptidoglycan-associated protein/tetratricopeptide (TPR) repeat protein
MKAIACLIVCLLLILNLDIAFTQPDAAIKETFDDAEYFFNLEDYQEALVSYIRIYKRGYQDNANINYRIGICYLHTNNEKAKAVAYLEKAVNHVNAKYQEGSLKETNAPYDAWLFLANAYRINNEPDKAIDAYQKYIELTGNAKSVDNTFALSQIEACKRWKEAEKNPVRIKISNLGKTINNTLANYNPVVSADESVLAYMTHLRFYDAIMVSYKIKGKWSVPVNITPDVQSDGDQYVCSISADGKTLFLSKQNNFNSHIYFSTFDGKKWSISKPLNKEINSRFWVSHACISPDGKILYFASNRTQPQNFGGSDIFYSELGKDGQWGPAKNIGPYINTPLNEETPFISADGNTLYFSSQGHESLGGYDIFYSVKQPDNTWSKPVNLGYPINGPDDDLFYCPVQNGNFAYQAKNLKGGFGDLDIVKIEVFSPNHPFKYRLTGNLADIFKNAKPNDFGVILIHEPDGENVDSSMYPEGGKMKFQAPAGNYSLKFLSTEFTARSKVFNIPEDFNKEEYALTPDELDVSKSYEEFMANKAGKGLEVKPNEISEISNEINGILFRFNDYKLTPEGEKNIINLSKLMTVNPSLELEITGYTDSWGSDSYNLKLSENRAKFVKARLVENGIASNRLKNKGLGKANPIAVNANPNGSDSPQGRAFNRRVEFKIIKCENKEIKVVPFNIPKNLKSK